MKLRCLLFVLYGSAVLNAGQVYGTIRENGKGVAGLAISIVSEAKVPYEVMTGPDGSFQVFVKEAGKCEFKVTYGTNKVAPGSVFSYATPAKYDFDLVGSNGTYTLKAR